MPCQDDLLDDDQNESSDWTQAIYCGDSFIITAEHFLTMEREREFVSSDEKFSSYLIAYGQILV